MEEGNGGLGPQLATIDSRFPYLEGKKGEENEDHKDREEEEPQATDYLP
jgi:hypothetical protein